MIVLLGATGYIGQAFTRELESRGRPFAAVSRKEIDYTGYTQLVAFLRRCKPEFLINAAGFTGKPNVDACEDAKTETLQGNTLLPITINHACLATGTPWGHVSSGCIYSGAKVLANGEVRVERDMSTPEKRRLAETQPERVLGFTEEDEPNFNFQHPPCSFYSGSKALAEEALKGTDRCYIWRLRIPFDEFDNPRNYLTKLQRYAKVYDNVNSISHRGEFARACVDLWDRRAPFGIYNMTNPGNVTARQVVEIIQRLLRPKKKFEYWADDREFYCTAARTPRSNCVMDVSKVLKTGVTLRPVQEAIADSLRNWQPTPR
jgi:dTDP-4-dehydrorhamnose reductase